MRTDSVNLSKDAMEAAEAEIIKSYGKEFSKPRTFQCKKASTEAHEAIRPTDMSLKRRKTHKDTDKLLSRYA
jgi:DNA topoisomerase-1